MHFYRRQLSSVLGAKGRFTLKIQQTTLNRYFQIFYCQNKPKRRGFIVFDFEKPKIEIAEISDDKKYGRFVVEPLERGYGTTLGNSLRRIMLSSLPGAAVSQV